MEAATPRGGWEVLQFCSYEKVGGKGESQVLQECNLFLPHSVADGAGSLFGNKYRTGS